MKQQYKILFFILWCCMFTSILAKAQSSVKYKPGNLIIQLTKNAYQRFNIKDGINTGLRDLDALLVKHKASSIQPLYNIQPKNKLLDERYGLSRTFLIKLPVDADIKSLKREYAGLHDVEAAEPNYLFYLSAPKATDKKTALAAQQQYHPEQLNKTNLFPNDPLYSLQWGHYNAGNTVTPYYGGGTIGIADSDADTQEAWNITTGSSSVVIAFIDSGIDWAHPEFSGRIIPGWNFEDNNNNTQDVYGHGTIVTGIAAATGNNGIGVAGVDWKCKIMPLLVFPNLDNAAGVNNIVNAIKHAADNGADIINMSFGSSFVYEEQPGFLESAINYAYNSSCALFAASGNDNHTTKEYPAAYENVMAIGALSPCNERKERIINGMGSCDKDTRDDWDMPWGSNYGSWLDLVAPGVILPTTDIVGMANGYSVENNCAGNIPYFCIKPTPDGNYLRDFLGTSIASPFAAGVASLMLSVNPGLTPADIYKILRNTANDIEAPGIDVGTGHGRINAYKAVQQAQVYKCVLSHVITQTIEESSLTYRAINSITATNSIYPNASGIYKAEGSIYLKPGFKVNSNGYHRSYIADCETNNFVQEENSLLQQMNDQMSRIESTTKGTELITAYPNPFTQTLTLAYTLPENGRVSCSIYDQYGKKITDLVAGMFQRQGRYVIKWNADKFAAGIYFYELQFNGKKETGKAIKVN